MLSRASRGKRWEIEIDGRTMDRFSSLEQAVEAVDYEIDQLGRAAAASARDDAPWRNRRAPGSNVTHADALRLVVWHAVMRQR